MFKLTDDLVLVLNVKTVNLRQKKKLMVNMLKNIT